MYEFSILYSIGYCRKVLTKSGVSMSRKCCFPHGLWNVAHHTRAYDLRKSNNRLRYSRLSLHGHSFTNWTTVAMSPNPSMLVCLDTHLNVGNAFTPFIALTHIESVAFTSHTSIFSFVSASSLSCAVLKLLQFWHVPLTTAMTLCVIGFIYSSFFFLATHWWHRTLWCVSTFKCLAFTTLHACAVVCYLR